MRRFSNFLGLFTLILREQRRFTSIWTQTLLAPIVTSALFIAVFSFVFSDRNAGSVTNNDYSLFIAPGILMMVTIQNSFANTSTSILVSKVNGNIVDTLMPSLSSLELSIGFMIGGAKRSIRCNWGINRNMSLFKPLSSKFFYAISLHHNGKYNIFTFRYFSRNIL